MSDTKYTKEYFIKKFEAIPDELWYVGKYTNPENPNCHCALGHCGESAPFSYGRTEESEALRNLSSSPRWNISTINDNVGFMVNYQGSTPKDRILNALKAL